MQIKMYCMYWF